jgi:DNA-binding transcriptional LysR family regulator
MEKLKTFYTIAKYKSFSKAGELLCLTQPAVSLQVNYHHQR